MATGDILQELPCAAGMKLGDVRMAVNSPNRKFGVLGKVRLSEGGAECIGGGADQIEAVLHAVDDNGVAYGETKRGGVAVSLDGEVVSFTGPVPIGVMTGGVAVHVLKNEQISGNQIR